MDGQSSPERCDDASSIVINQTTSADDELTVGSGEESDSEDSSEHDSDDLTARNSFAGKNGRVCLPRVPHHQEHVHLVLDTQRRPIGAAKNIQYKVDPFAYFIDEYMLEQVVKHTNERARRDLRKRSKNPDEWMPFDLCEMKDIVDVLYLIGVYRGQHESLHSL